MNRTLCAYVRAHRSRWQGPPILLSLYFQPSYPSDAFCIYHFVVFSPLPCGQRKINVFVLLLLAFDSLHALRTFSCVSVWTSQSHAHSNLCYASSFHLFLVVRCGHRNNCPLIEMWPARSHTYAHSAHGCALWDIFGSVPAHWCWNRFTAQRNANAYTVASSRCAVRVCVCAIACVFADCGEFSWRALGLAFFSLHTIFCCYSLRSVVDGVLTVVQVSASLCEDGKK